MPALELIGANALWMMKDDCVINFLLCGFAVAARCAKVLRTVLILCGFSQSSNLEPTVNAFHR